MNADDLLHRIITEKVNKIDAPLLSETHDVDEIIKKLDLQSIQDDILRRQHDNAPWTVDLTFNDYAPMIEGLNSNSTLTKIKVLDKLLNIDIDTKQVYWEELSQSLRKCFVSANYDIFIRTLKIHHRLQYTSCDGYLNLLKGTFLLLNSRYFTDVNKTRIFQCFKVVLNSQKAIMRFLLHSSHNVIDEITTAFINVLTYKTVFDWFVVLDPESNWIRIFCYGADIRNSFFNNLKEKKPEFIKHIVATFLQNVSSDELMGTHYGHFLLYFWRYKSNVNFLPEEISVEKTLEAIIVKLSDGKRGELMKLFIDLFNHNPLLITPKLLDVLMAPFIIVNRNNIRSLVNTNKFVFTIINSATKSRSCRVIFGIYGTRRARPRQIIRNITNLTQKVTDITNILLKININSNELNHDVDTLSILLHSCMCIYDNPLAMLHVNPTKLIKNLHEFYGMNWKNQNRTVILPLFTLFLKNYGPSINILDCDNDALTDLLTYVPIEDLKIIINRLSCHKNGFDFIKRHRRQIIKPYLEELTEETDATTNKFVLFLFIVKLTARSVVALLSDDDDETVIENTSNQITLSELIEKGLNEFTDSPEEYLGLLALKVLITNLDLLLRLQTNHQLQEKLKEEREETGIIDAQSSLRRNILISLECVGFVDKGLNENLGEVQLVNGPLEFEMFGPYEGENEFKTFLEEEMTVGDFTWVSQARRVFKSSLNIFDPSLMALLLVRIPKTYVYRKVELQWPPTDSVYYQLHPEDFSGVSLIIDYGLKTGLLQPLEDNKHSDNLILLIKQSRTFVGHQPESFTNFDWFVGIVFLICAGQFDQCKSILINFTNTQVTSLIWSTFGKEFDYELQEKFHQHFAVVLEENCTCFQALKVLGISPEILVQSWLNQCFFNFLHFEEICNFLAFSVLYPVECLLYYLLAIFRHLNDRICTITHSSDVKNILDMCDMSQFQLVEHMPMIEKLTKQYRNAHKL